MYACDCLWWRKHYRDVKSVFSGELWTQDVSWDDAKPKDLNVLTSLNGSGLNKQPGIIHRGNNSGYQAINFALHLGASRIILLGYDMRGQGEHFFGKHNGYGLSPNTDYSTFLGAFKTINPEEYGIEIINCSRKTALNCFTKKELEEVLDNG